MDEDTKPELGAILEHVRNRVMIILHDAHRNLGKDEGDPWISAYADHIKQTYDDSYWGF